MRRAHLRSALACAVLVGAGVAPAAPAHAAGVNESPEIRYMTDSFTATRCSGAPTGDLHYKVFSPSTPGRYPIVFGMQGTGFQGSADCAGGREKYRQLDSKMKQWAQQGFVAVNVEYHGTNNGLFGKASYPGTTWGSRADGTTELNVKKAVRFFFNNNPAQWNADESKGVLAFGGSSGAHNAFMLADTSPVYGHRFAAAIGYSGLPDEANAGRFARETFVDYMCSSPCEGPQDLLDFGDPIKRITALSPPHYIANSEGEFVSYESAENYFDRCGALGIPMCWVRIVKGNAHSMAYFHQAFDPVCTDGNGCDLHVEPAATRPTVFEDTVQFARLAVA